MTRHEWQIPRSGVAGGRTLFRNKVVFKPIVGMSYMAHGRDYLGKRVMVLGTSNYCEHYKDEKGCGEACAHYGKYYLHVVGRKDPLYFGARCEKFSEIVYMRYCNRLKEPKLTDGKDPNAWMRTFSRFFNSFFVDGNPSDKVRNQLLDHIVCTEYVQGAEADKGSKNSKELMESDRNYHEFVKQVKLWKPDVVIVWGKRVWREVCRRIGIVGKGAVMKEVSFDGCLVKLLTIPHPSSYGSTGFQRKEFQRLLKRAEVKLLSTRK